MGRAQGKLADSQGDPRRRSSAPARATNGSPFCARPTSRAPVMRAYGIHRAIRRPARSRCAARSPTPRSAPPSSLALPINLIDTPGEITGAAPALPHDRGDRRSCVRGNRSDGSIIEPSPDRAAALRQLRRRTARTPRAARSTPASSSSTFAAISPARTAPMILAQDGRRGHQDRIPRGRRLPPFRLRLPRMEPGQTRPRARLHHPRRPRNHLRPRPAAPISSSKICGPAGWLVTVSTTQRSPPSIPASSICPSTRSATAAPNTISPASTRCCRRAPV